MKRIIILLAMVCVLVLPGPAESRTLWEQAQNDFGSWQFHVSNMTMTGLFVGGVVGGVTGAVSLPVAVVSILASPLALYAFANVYDPGLPEYRKAKARQDKEREEFKMGLIQRVREIKKEIRFTSNQDLKRELIKSKREFEQMLSAMK